MLLFLDTETTGIPEWHTPSGDDCQPHIVQLAAALVDKKSLEIKSAFNVIIRPDGWEIPDETAEIHGIDTGLAERVGIPEKFATSMLLSFWERSNLQAGHNVNFDRRIVRIATKRYFDEEIQEDWKAGDKYCTMYNSTNILKIPQTKGRGKYKFPTLSEAYKHFTGKDLENAHGAWADLNGCIEVYRCLTSK